MTECAQGFRRPADKLHVKVHLTTAAILGLAWQVHGHAHGLKEYSAGWESQWVAQSEGDPQCALHSDLNEYGRASFVTDDRGALVFELQAHADLQSGESVRVKSLAPPWHPDFPSNDDLGEALHISGGGLIGRDALARRMLHRLEAGFELHLATATWFDERREVRLVLSPVALRTALAEFLACAKTRVSVSWTALSRSRVSYPVDVHELSAADLLKLDAVVRYVSADSKVAKIYVDGHADASGMKLSNHRLSRRRATHVADYLHTALTAQDRNGVEIVVRYHGAEYPVADNRTAAGKALNRRTTIRLERKTGTHTETQLAHK